MISRSTKKLFYYRVENVWFVHKYCYFLHLLKRVDFNTTVDHLTLAHIIKSKADPTTSRIKRLLEVFCSYSFNLYYIKGKDMILSDFLSRQKQDDCNSLDIIPISFNMQNILQSRYYNISGREQGKYLVQKRSQAKSSGITLPEVHGVDKEIDPNTRPEKQVIKPIITSEAKGISQVKPRLGQGTAGIKQKTLTFPVSPLLDKPEQLQLLPGRRPIILIAEKSILQQPQNIIQPKTKLKISVPEISIVPESSQLHDKVIPLPN